eukprot:7417791-Prorocentrum_lima.AAC.1
MAAPMMQPGVVTLLAAPMGQTAVAPMDASMGQTTVQRMETPLNTSWEYAQYAQLPLPTTVPQALTPNTNLAATSAWPG